METGISWKPLLLKVIFTREFNSYSTYSTASASLSNNKTIQVLDSTWIIIQKYSVQSRDQKH